MVLISRCGLEIEMAQDILIDLATSTVGTLEILKRIENWEVVYCDVVIETDEHSSPKKLANQKETAATDTD